MEIMSIDAETNGLWGQAFSIGAILVDGTGEIKSAFVGRCPIEGDVNNWVRDNVLPQMTDIPVDRDDYRTLLTDFFDWRKANGCNATEIVHMGVPVEAQLYRDAHEMGIIGDLDGPYPLVDISALPEIGTSVDSYNAAHGIDVPTTSFAGTHNPLYDATAAAVAYRHWLTANGY